MTHKTEVDLLIPNSEDLCCINCKVDLADVQDPIVKSLFHYKILTCRLLIYTVNCCIASPSIQNIGDLIHVIVSKNFYSTGKLQKHLSDLNIKFTDPDPVHPAIYKACLKYTFTFKLAPHWNLIDRFYYLRKFDFTTLPCNEIDAVKWNIFFKGGKAKLEIIPMKMNLSPFTLEFLNIPSELLENFRTNSYSNISYIDLTLFQCPWAYVLPKLSRARVISVSNKLPDSCIFENYEELRRHWKNMYSYYLPKTDQGMLFYEVVFPMNPNVLFTYPEMCILSKKPEILMCGNKDEMALEFIKDISTNVYIVCNQEIKIGRLCPDINYSSYLYKNKKNKFDKCPQWKENLDDLSSPFFEVPVMNRTKPKQRVEKEHQEVESDYQQLLSLMTKYQTKIPEVKCSELLIEEMMSKKNKIKYQDECQNQKSLLDLSVNQEKTLLENLIYVPSKYNVPSNYNSQHPEVDKENFTPATTLSTHFKKQADKYLSSLTPYNEVKRSKDLTSSSQNSSSLNTSKRKKLERCSPKQSKLEQYFQGLNYVNENKVRLNDSQSLETTDNKEKYFDLSQKWIYENNGDKMESVSDRSQNSLPTVEYKNNSYNNKTNTSFKDNSNNLMCCKTPQMFEYKQNNESFDKLAFYEKELADLYNESEHSDPDIMFEKSLDENLIKITKSPVCMFTSNNNLNNEQNLKGYTENFCNTLQCSLTSDLCKNENNKLQEHHYFNENLQNYSLNKNAKHLHQTLSPISIVDSNYSIETEQFSEDITQRVHDILGSYKETPNKKLF